MPLHTWREGGWGRTLVISSGLRIQMGFCLLTSCHSWLTSFTFFFFFSFLSSSSTCAHVTRYYDVLDPCVCTAVTMRIQLSCFVLVLHLPPPSRHVSLALELWDIGHTVQPFLSPCFFWLRRQTGCRRKCSSTVCQSWHDLATEAESTSRSVYTWR